MTGSNNGTLSELERVKLENFALRHNTLQQQIHVNLTARGAFIRELEVAHPGYRWEDEQGVLVPVESDKL